MCSVRLVDRPLVDVLRQSETTNRVRGRGIFPAQGHQRRRGMGNIPGTRPPTTAGYVWGRVLRIAPRANPIRSAKNPGRENAA
eukprot:565222-Prorocentrum_minimum.AAC.1